MCRAVLPRLPKPGLGFNGSIYFMLAALAGTGFWVTRVVKKSLPANA